MKIVDHTNVTNEPEREMLGKGKGIVSGSFLRTLYMILPTLILIVGSYIHLRLSIVELETRLVFLEVELKQNRTYLLQSHEDLTALKANQITIIENQKEINSQMKKNTQMWIDLYKQD